LSNKTLTFSEAGKKKRTKEDLIPYLTDPGDVGLSAELQSQSDNVQSSWRYCMKRTFNGFSQPRLGASFTDDLHFLNFLSDSLLGHFFGPTIQLLASFWTPGTHASP
jgi:hypothetical protein